MLYHGFIGTIADNSVEIGWILCFSLLADKSLVERITILFGVNDAFWVILSSTYYTARTSLTAILPKLIEEKGEAIENNKDKINELKEKLNLNELPKFLIDEIITGSFEYSHQKLKDRAAKFRSNELQQAIKDRKQKQNRLFKNPFKN